MLKVAIITLTRWRALGTPMILDAMLSRVSQNRGPHYGSAVQDEDENGRSATNHFFLI